MSQDWISASENVRSPRLGLAVVLVDVTADGDRGRAAVGAVERVAVGHRRRGGGHLPGGTGGVLALGRPVDGRGPVLLAEQRVELVLRDAVGPDAGVVVGVAGHGHDLTGGGHHHGRALVGVVPGLPGLLDRRVQRVLRDDLNLGVEAGHQVVAGLGGGAAHGAGDVAGRVDREHVGTGLAGQRLVVLLLQPGLADQVRGGVADLGGQVVLLQLLGGGGLQVTENLGRVGAVRGGIGDDPLGLGGHPRELALLLHDLQRDLLGDVLIDRDGLVGRPGPARLLDLGRAQPGLLLQQLVRRVQHGGQPLQHRHAAVAALGQRHHVHRHHQLGAVGDQGVAHVVQDLPADGGDDDVPGLVLRGQLGVAGAVHHLDVPKAAAQRDQQREPHHVQHQQAPP